MPIDFSSSKGTSQDSHSFLEGLGLISKPVSTATGPDNYYKIDNSPDTGFLEDTGKLASNVGKGLANISIGGYNTIMHPIDTLTNLGEGAINTGKNIIQGAEKLSGAGMNLADKAVYGGMNAVTGQDIKPKDIPGVFTQGTPANQSVGADIIQGISGALGASQGLFPVASTLFNAGSNTEVGKQALAPVMGISQTVTDLAKQVPMVSDFYKGLSHDRQADFDNVLNSAIQFGATEGLAGTKPVENLQNDIIKGAKEFPGKTVDFVRPTRTTEEVGANILQPSKTMTPELEQATNGLRTITEGMNEKGANFDTLSKRADELIKQQSESIKADLENVDRFGDKVKNKYINNALGELSDTLKNEGSSKYEAIKNEVQSLINKHATEGLNATQVNRVKELYTQNEGLFNAKGQETGGFSADSQRATRQDLRSIVEDMATKAGVPEIGMKNKIIGEVINAKTMLENQQSNRKSYLGRKANESPLQKAVSFVMDLPGVKQIATAPLQTIFQKIGGSLKEGKINVLEIEKQLPKLIAELKRAGVKEGDITRVQNTLTNAVKASKTANPTLLPAPSGKPLSAKNVDIRPRTGTPNESAFTAKQGNKPGTTSKEFISKSVLPNGQKLLPSPTTNAQGPTIKGNMSQGEIITRSKKDIANAKISTIKPKKPAQKLLPAPRVPQGTILPRTDIVAESMRNTNSKRPDITPKIKPRK